MKHAQPRNIRTRLNLQGAAPVLQANFRIRPRNRTANRVYLGCSNQKMERVKYVPLASLVPHQLQSVRRVQLGNTKTQPENRTALNVSKANTSLQLELQLTLPVSLVLLDCIHAAAVRLLLVLNANQAQSRINLKEPEARLAYYATQESFP